MNSEYYFQEDDSLYGDYGYPHNAYTMNFEEREGSDFMPLPYAHLQFNQQAGRSDRAPIPTHLRRIEPQLLQSE